MRPQLLVLVLSFPLSEDGDVLQITGRIFVTRVLNEGAGSASKETDIFSPIFCVPSTILLPSLRPASNDLIPPSSILVFASMHLCLIIFHPPDKGSFLNSDVSAPRLRRLSHDLRFLPSLDRSPFAVCFTNPIYSRSFSSPPTSPHRGLPLRVPVRYRVR